MTTSELAIDAIDYVLGRIRDDENIRYHMGSFTEAYERLKTAQSAIHQIDPAEVDRNVFGKKLQRKAHAAVIVEIKDVLHGQGDAPRKLAAINDIIENA